MRILDTDSDTATKSVILYLKPEEARDLCGYLRGMLTKDDVGVHAHIYDSSCEHEIIVAIYDERQPELFDERSQKIILEDA